MERTREEIMPGVWLTALRTDKFKTDMLSITLLSQLCRESAAMNAVIPSVLRRGTTRYPDMDSIAAELDELYGAAAVPAVRRLGEIGISFSDLDTKTSSLEDIFVSLVHSDGAPKAAQAQKV